jgi:hypothetical protein
MSQVIVEIVSIPDDDPALELEARPMSPAQIVDALVQIDPDDLADLQQALYDACLLRSRRRT